MLNLTIDWDNYLRSAATIVQAVGNGSATSTWLVSVLSTSLKLFKRGVSAYSWVETQTFPLSAPPTQYIVEATIADDNSTIVYIVSNNPDNVAGTLIYPDVRFITKSGDTWSAAGTPITLGTCSGLNIGDWYGRNRKSIINFSSDNSSFLLFWPVWHFNWNAAWGAGDASDRAFLFTKTGGVWSFVAWDSELATAEKTTVKVNYNTGWGGAWIVFYVSPTEAVEFYFNVTTSSPILAPGRSGEANRVVEILLLATDTVNQIATKIKDRIDADVAFVATVAADTVTVTNVYKGALTPPSNSSALPATITTVEKGYDYDYLHHEAVISPDGSRCVEVSGSEVVVRTRASSWKRAYKRFTGGPQVSADPAGASFENNTDFIVNTNDTLTRYVWNGSTYVPATIPLPLGRPLAGDTEPCKIHIKDAAMLVSYIPVSKPISSSDNSRILRYVKINNDWVFDRETIMSNINDKVAYLKNIDTGAAVFYINKAPGAETDFAKEYH